MNVLFAVLTLVFPPQGPPPPQAPPLAVECPIVPVRHALPRAMYYQPTFQHAPAPVVYYSQPVPAFYPGPPVTQTFPVSWRPGASVGVPRQLCPGGVCPPVQWR